jgi:FMN-dependent NADH-azoreductase
MNLLHLDSSILGPGSVSRLLTADIVAAQTAKHPGLTVTYRDLAAEPLLHLSGLHLAAAQAGPAEHAPAFQHDLASGQAALEEFLAADIVVVGAPMYNFCVPSQLKAWIDRITIAGKTFTYGETGPVGLAGGKTVIIASSRGGVYAAETPMAALDHQEAYLKILFGFLGVTDISVIRAEGVAMGPEARSSAIAAAKAAIAA